MNNPLRLNLDDIDFDRLVAEARATIPTLAPGWTDHNLHDPGIMLLELMAWVADQQIYALSRDRTDERQAFAAAMGLRRTGPRPAAGLLWPLGDPGTGPPPWPNGTPAAQNAAATLEGREGPTFVLRDDVTLTTARITGVTVLPLGEPASPAQVPLTPGGVEPFGASAQAGARFQIRLRGPLLAPGEAGRPRLSLGVETDAPQVDDSRARLSAWLQVGGRQVPVPVARDDTAALAQAGVLLLDLSALVGQPAADDAILTLVLDRARRAHPARVTRLALNVLAVRQVTTAILEAKGTGLPNQQVPLPEGQLSGDAADPPSVVRLTGGADEVWTVSPDLQTAGPADRVFQFDPSARVVRFGNGVNGRVPPVGAELRITCRASAGARGDIASGAVWALDHVLGRFTNLAPTAGGRDPDGLAEFRRASRRRARDSRPLVTDADLVAAAMAAVDLKVRRAEVLGGYEPDRCARVAGLARTLVLLGAWAGQADAEPAAWLDLLRRRLRPRFMLGDRVRVIRPAYVPLRLRATLTPMAGQSPDQVLQGAGKVLTERLRLIPEQTGDAVWPIGLDVQAHDIAGWLRRAPGVAAVREVAIGAPEAALGRSVHLPRHGLPVLVREAGDLTIGPAS